MLWVIGAVMLVAGGWVCMQSTSTRFAPPIAVGGAAILICKIFG